MRISFDLDDTLILYDDPHPEPNRVPFFLRFYYTDRFRLGGPRLLKRLREEGWEIYIYTTSYRSKSYIKRLFTFYGIRIDEVINQAAHAAAFRDKRGHEVPSKYPSRWRIDLHVDDCEVLQRNGERYGFRVLRIDPADKNWTQRVTETTKNLKDNL